MEASATPIAADIPNADSSKTLPSEGRITEHFIRCMEVARQPRQPEPIQPVASDWRATRTECLWHRSGLTDLHMDAVRTIDPATAPWATAYEILERQGQTDDGYMVAFCGNRGTGKTQCAAHLIRRTVERDQKARYAKLSALVRQVYDSYSDRTRRTDAIIREAAEVRLLVLDECHEALRKEDARAIFTDIFDNRYGTRQRNTILIANERREALAAMLGDSVTSRLIEKGGVVEFNHPSFRRQPEWARGLR